ncbi:MAG TPA: class I SAM-dependent methyltransferase, partial [Gaiellaceae bacterium]|nr:class I SAM-dependent methyltransferase [Gaiellaceae bacterium]
DHGLALELARRGAAVVGVDLAADGVAHARAAALEAGVEAAFEVADACALPYGDGSFDGVVSAFGVVFASEPERAAAELARVCRSEGRLGLTLVPRATRTAALWTTLLRHGHPGPHPADWEQRLDELLGGDFDLAVELRESPEAEQPPRLDWEQWVAAFPPLRELAARLDPAALAALRADFERIDDDDLHGTAASYLLVRGRRR